MVTPFRVRAGDIVTRAELAVDYGGNLQYGGIVASNSTNSVFIFTDPSKSKQFGYVYDGFDANGTVLHYTGAGPSGDQSESKSNSSILTAAARGRRLHAFVTVGTVPGTTTKRQKYIGEFILDSSDPFARHPGLGEDGAARTVLVFRLLPVTAIPTSIIESVGFSGVAVHPRAVGVPVEINSTTFYETAETPARTSYRRESDLVDEFIASKNDHTFSRWAITLPELRQPLLTDVYDEGDHVLYEAKAFSRRGDLRMAIGQLYDYRRHIDVPDLQCRVLLPDRPSSDLRDLIQSAGLGLTFREHGSFTVEPALTS